jgi:dimethylglycine dehydrogenase
MVKAHLARPGTEFEVEIFGEKRRAVVHDDAALWDPGNLRLRS